ISEEQAIEQMDAHLQRSVRMQLLSDVKVGCQLSGGIDSSMISVLALRYLAADLDTFSIVFRDPDWSEEQWINTATALAYAHGHPLARSPLAAAAAQAAAQGAHLRSRLRRRQRCRSGQLVHDRDRISSARSSPASASQRPL